MNMESIFRAAQTHRLDSLFPLFDACHSASSRQDFAAKVHPELCKIIPHSMFVCGTASIDNLAANFVALTANHVENISFPESYLEKIIERTGRINSPLVRHWLRTRSPVYYDEQTVDIGLHSTDSEWKELFNKYGFHSLAAHGMLDVSGKAASYFCFAGISTWNKDLQGLLELVVPHLHVALTRQTATHRTVDDYLLSPRESEILKLICLGKTNREMGLILGISPWTVKIHVRNFMSKLNVSTRGHAVAKAMEHGLVSNPRIF